MNHIRITYDYHMCYCCKSAANAMQGERIEREGDIPIYRDIERPRDWEIGNRETERLGGRKPRDRETRKPRDRETRKPGAEIRRRMESK